MTPKQNAGPIAVLLMAHGGPDTLDDIEPFLRHIMKDREPSPEIIATVTERYRLIGGGSPLLKITQQQAKVLDTLLNHNSKTNFRVYIGMRHWRPWIKDVIRQVVADAPTHLVALCLAPQYSQMSVGAYLDALKTALTDVGEKVSVSEIKSLWPYLQDAYTDRVNEALSLYRAREISPFVLFTAHSLPERILKIDDPYPAELEATVKGIVERLGTDIQWDFAYQSKGMSKEAWLGPDVEEVIARLADDGHRHLLIAPIGFVCDHVEILYDIDILYKGVAETHGIELRRIQSLNDAESLGLGLAKAVYAHLPSESD